MLIVLDENLHQVLHADAVLSWNDNFSVGSLCVDGELGNGLEPPLPCVGFNVEEPVIHFLFCREVFDAVFLHSFAHPLVKAFTTNVT